MFEKVNVKGKGRHPLFSWLSEKKLNDYGDCPPSWNFCKYIINESGDLIANFGPKTSPLSDNIIDLIKSK